MENQTVLVPMMLFGWIPISILSFWLLRPHHAVLFSMIGGWLFLPMTGYDIRGFPDFDKKTAISLGLLFGSFLSGNRQEVSYQWKNYDLPIIFWCLCPIATSLSNQLGLYDGLSTTLRLVTIYGIPYFIGRIYFHNIAALRDLCLGIIIGGLLYFPLSLYEIRMSPQLHANVYGFFQHSFAQHMRYGGFRPIVFMQHGLMVSLWMAISAMVTFWYWRNIEESNLKGIPFSLIFIVLAVTTLLCKSANGWAMLILGTCCSILYRNFNVPPRLFTIFILIIPIYLVVRILGLLPTQEILSVASIIFDNERVHSLAFRLAQEDLISVEVLKRPFLGWGKFGRGLPVDPETGEILLHVRDSLWLISFQYYGFIGIFSLYTSLLLGPWLILTKSKKPYLSGSNHILTFAIVLSLVVIFFCIDSLFNSMVNPIYIMISGVLLTISMEIHKRDQDGNFLKS